MQQRLRGSRRPEHLVSTSWGAKQSVRFNRADVMFSQAFLQVVAKSNETIRFDASAKRLELRKEQQ
eukprot:3611524-Lingulodinium_polyedra.AAC.1